MLMVFLEKLVFMAVSGGVYTRNSLSYDSFDKQKLLIAFPFLFPKLLYCN